MVTMEEYYSLMNICTPEDRRKIALIALAGGFMLERMAFEAFKISGERIAERVIEAVIINLCTMTIRDVIKDLKEKKKVEVYYQG